MSLEEKVLKRFLEYVEISSETGNEKAFSDKLIQDLSHIGAEIVRDKAGEKANSNTDNLFVYFPGNHSQEVMLFSCHMDTVSEGKPIHPVVEEGVVRSAGDTILSGDDKAGIAALVTAMEELNKKGEHYGPVQLVFTVSEEKGLKGSRYMDMTKLLGTTCFVVDSSGPIGKVITSAPFQNRLHASITGKPAHAGVAPENGISAIQVGAQAISQMKLLRIDEETTANIGSFIGKGPTNIVSERVEIEGEVRSLDEKKLEQQTDHMIKCIHQACEEKGAKVELKVDRMYDGYRISVEDPFLQLYKRVCGEMGIPVQLAATGGGSDANIYNSRGITTLNIGTGVAYPHAVEEQISVKDLEQLTRLLMGLIRR